MLVNCKYVLESFSDLIYCFQGNIYLFCHIQWKSYRYALFSRQGLRKDCISNENLQKTIIVL